MRGILSWPGTSLTLPGAFLLCWAVCAAFAQGQSPYVTVPSDRSAQYRVNATQLESAVGDLTGYMARISAGVDHFHIVVENANCPVRRTSDLATEAHCAYAVNGGPFNMRAGAGCVGAVIVNHTAMTSDYAGGNAMFAATDSGNWVIGHVPNATTANALGVRDLVTGFGWLVRDGKMTPGSGGEQAPRTAVGVDSSGRLLIVEVDGCEKCADSSKRGPTLAQMATLMASQRVGAVHAINLDGGGSSTSFANGTVIDRPTCIDVNIRCERKVASILCIR